MTNNKNITSTVKRSARKAERRKQEQELSAKWQADTKSGVYNASRVNDSVARIQRMNFDTRHKPR